MSGLIPAPASALPRVTIVGFASDATGGTYQSPVGYSVGSNTERDVEFVVPAACTLKSLRFVCQELDAGTAQVLKVRLNGADSTLTHTFPANTAAGTQAAVAGELPLVAGDRLAISRSLALRSFGGSFILEAA